MDEQTTIEHIEECESSLGAPHGTPKLRTYKYGWNGYENAYEGSEWLCDECYEAMSQADVADEAVAYVCFECGKVSVGEAASLCRECEKEVFGE